MKEISIQHDLGKAPKTGDWSFVAPVVDKEKCIGCGNCVPFCPEASIEMRQATSDKRQGKNKAEVDYEYCKGCGVCADVCPVKAIIMKKK